LIIDAAKRFMPEEDTRPLSEGGTGAVAYGDAVATYMALAVDRAADAWSSAVTWASSGETFRTTFAFPTLRRGWDFAEANPFSESAGSFERCVERVAETLEMVPAGPVARGASIRSRHSRHAALGQRAGGAAVG
jgi:putative DNA methylase